MSRDNNLRDFLIRWHTIIQAEEKNENSKKEKPSLKNKKKRKRKQYILAPSIDNLESLIEIGMTHIPYSNINYEILWNILPELKELNNLIGMNQLKKSIFYQIIYYLQDLHKQSNDEYLHTVIFGPPGCGKTTVAKILGNIYRKMKILSTNKDIFKIAKREDFVGEYLGHTATKTKRLLNSCRGGVLFIDEAYSLGPGQKDKDSFSKEAIDTLNVFLSEHKHEFCCILAGYEKEIKKCFFSVNPGLERRFQWIHRIEEYTSEDLAEMVLQKIKEINWHTTLTKKKLINIIKENEDLFKNIGGDVENLISKSKMIHARRVFNLDKKHRFMLNQDDILKGIEVMKDNKMKKEDNSTKNLLHHMYV